MVAQTIRPQEWVIVSDGSVDRTDEIARSSARRFPFIHFERVGGPAQAGKKDFSSKVRAFRAGYVQLAAVPYQFVGNLDADITFEPSYFEAILERFAANPRLGLAGGRVHEPGQEGWVPQRTSLNSVAGAVQLFRRECYEEFGGYVPLCMGGVDAAAEIMARMNGWQVQLFPELKVYTQRKVSTGGATQLHTRYRQGISNYLLGYHPVFELASCLLRVRQKPYLIGSIFSLLGFTTWWIKRQEKSLPANVIEYLRSEQMQRIFLFLSSPLTPACTIKL